MATDSTYLRLFRMSIFVGLMSITPQFTVQLMAQIGAILARCIFDKIRICKSNPHNVCVASVEQTMPRIGDYFLKKIFFTILVCPSAAGVGIALDHFVTDIGDTGMELARFVHSTQ